MIDLELSRNITIGQYIPTGSIVHRLDPRAKLLTAFCLIVTISFARSIIANVLLMVVILAIARPDLSVTLSESVAKKAKAVAASVGELDLPVAVEHARAESLLETRRFDSLVARGVAPLHRILTWFEPRWDAIGQLFLIKGKNWTAERSDARSRGLLRDLELRRLTTYTTPRTDNISVILRVSPKED